jgi:hypothetical protein
MSKSRIIVPAFYIVRRSREVNELVIHNYIPIAYDRRVEAASLMEPKINYLT